MRSLDTETALIRPGLQAPPIACLSIATDDHPPEIHDDLTGPARFRECLKEPFCGVNVAYDLACAMAWGWAEPREIFDAYDNGRVFDLSVHERIVEIGGWAPPKELSLANLARTYGMGEMDKGSVRVSYEPLVGRPIDEFTSEQIRYAITDATQGLALWHRMRKRWDKAVSLTDVAEQTRKMWWLHLCRCWGLRTDPKRVAELEIACREHIDELKSFAQGLGFIRPNGKRNMKAIREAVARAYEGKPPMTKAQKNRKSKKPFVPQVSTAAATLEESGDPLLCKFAEYGEWSSVNNKDLKFLTSGATIPIHTRFRIVDTTRTSSSSPNVQNIRRKEGIRECFIPRPGHCFVAIDHGGLELATLAQCCVSLLGRWEMATKINAGIDLHSDVGSHILGIPYEAFLSLKAAGDAGAFRARQCGKIVNFGRPGGMSAPTLRIHAKTGYDTDLTLEECEGLISTWNRANPDGAAFLRYIRTLQRGERFNVTIPGTSISREGITYCSAANCHFQGLGASLEGWIGYLLAREIYCGTGPLSRARMCNFVHDEFIFECPVGMQTEVAHEAHRVLTTECERYLPDVKIGAEYAAMSHWSKNAKASFRNGELQIYG